jgi:molybdopterin-guanine dinucleotide biosynthesis protein MobB
MSKKIPVFSFVGYSGSGKTTLIEKLIKELKKRGVRVGVIKHDAHEFEIDKEGKDTYRFFQAGADTVLISSKTKAAKIQRTSQELTLDGVLENVMGLDLIITEGYRAGNAPKIGVLRKAAGHSMSVPLSELSALVTDKKIESDIPVFGLEEILQLADFLLEKSDVSTIPEGLELKDAVELLLSVPVNIETEKMSIEKSLGRIKG